MHKSNWQEEFNKVKEILPEAKIEWVLENYIAFKIKGKDYTLVAYPHKTSAGNHHIRIRDENSKDKFKAVGAMKKLDDSENSCTFSVKKWPEIPGSQMNPVKKSRCEVCGGNVEVAGNTTKHYINKDQEKIKYLKALLIESRSWLSHFTEDLPVEETVKLSVLEDLNAEISKATR